MAFRPTAGSQPERSATTSLDGFTRTLSSALRLEEPLAYSEKGRGGGRGEEGGEEDGGRGGKEEKRKEGRGRTGRGKEREEERREREKSKRRE